MIQANAVQTAITTEYGFVKKNFFGSYHDRESPSRPRWRAFSMVPNPPAQNHSLKK